MYNTYVIITGVCYLLYETPTWGSNVGKGKIKLSLVLQKQ